MIWQIFNNLTDINCYSSEFIVDRLSISNTRVVFYISGLENKNKY